MEQKYNLLECTQTEPGLCPAQVFQWIFVSKNPARLHREFTA